MADVTVKTPLPKRNDLQELTTNIRLIRAFEQLFIDVSQTLPSAIDNSNNNNNNTTEVSASLDVTRQISRIFTELGSTLDTSSASQIKKLSAKIADVQSQVETLRPVKPRLEGFNAPTLLNSWVNFGGTRNPVGYYKDQNSRVYLRGVIKSGVVGSAAFTLPSGYRPANAEIFSVVSNDLFGAVNVLSTGDVTPAIGSNVYFSLDGISFRAA